MESKTTFDPLKVIQPLYTGGGVGLARDGRLLATCLGEDVLLSDLQTGTELARIEGDGEAITSLCLTLAGAHIALCSRSLSLRIYSLDATQSEGSVKASLVRTLKPHSTPVVTSSTDRTGTLLATGAADGEIKVWDIQGGYVTHSFRARGGVVSALHFFELSGDEQPATEKKAKKSKKKEGQKGSGGFRLASGSDDGSIRIWDLHQRKNVGTLESHVSVVRGLAFTQDHNVLISASRDKTVIVWDARTWKVKKIIPVLELIESVGIFSGGQLLFTAGESGRLRIWNWHSGHEITKAQEPRAESEAILDVQYHDEMDFLVSVHADQSLILHSLDSLGEEPHADSLSSLVEIRRISGTHDEIIDMAFVGGDKSMMALATNEEDIRIISTRLDSQEADTGYFGADVALLRGHEDIVICLDVDWSGHWLATGAKDNTARIWRLDPASDSFECYATLTGHAESVGAIALPRAPPSGKQTTPLDQPPPFVLTGSQDRTIKRWNLSGDAVRSSGKVSNALYTRKAHDKDINALDTNSSGTRFASASQDRNVKIWSTEEGEVQGILRGHRRGVWSVRFPPNESVTVPNDQGASSGRGLVLTGSGDKTVKIWSLSDFSCLRTFEGHTNSILKVLWLPVETDSTARAHQPVRVASAGGDGLVKVWDATTGELACTLDNHVERVWALATKPAPSNILVSGGGDGVITFWQDTTEATAAASSEAATRRIEQEQELQNYMHTGAYREAITLALALNHPGRLLGLFSTVVNNPEPDTGSLTGSKAVDEVIATLADEQLFKLLLRIRDWNTNTRTAPVAQRLMWTIFKTYPPNKLVSLTQRRRVREAEDAEDPDRPRTRAGAPVTLKELLDGIRAYTERHYRRVEELIDESYLLDYTLGEMDEVVLEGEGEQMMLEERPEERGLEWMNGVLHEEEVVA